MTKLPATMKKPIINENRVGVLVCAIIIIVILLLAVFSIVFSHHLIPINPG